MAYQTPLTIKDAIDAIKKRQYVLPSIQREFVWGTEQIETLFDSLMRDYPISTFLFWKVDKTKIKDFQFYEFLKNYHEKDGIHNPKVDLPTDQDVIAVLDGQQRMTSMYIALTGSYAEKAPYQRWDSPYSFPKTKLYLNLLKPADDAEKQFDFRFLTDYEASKNENGYFWFECGKVLGFKEISEVMEFLMVNSLTDTSKHTQEESRFALKTLNEFFNVVHQKGTISYYLENSIELDKVLQIFIRINSGGTKLSYSDLLLSIATAQWKERDAREVIHQFVDELNRIGDGFDFNKDLILKSCLVLADFSDIKFNVDNFNKENMLTIEKNWEKVSSAIRTAVELVAKFGFNRDSLLATNTIIPIAYFIHKNNFEKSIIHGGDRDEDRKSIKEWLARVLLKGTFGGQPDSIYPGMRDVINDNLGRFPLKEIIDHYRGKRKSITFTLDDIESILNMQYGKPKTFCALSLLYPGLNNNFRYHQDHIHPKSMFNKKTLKANGVAEDQIDSFVSTFNTLPNLQLLQATENVEKNATPFKSWLESTYKDQSSRESYLMQHYVKTTLSLELVDFIEFFQTRKDEIKNQLIKILSVGSAETGLIEE